MGLLDVPRGVTPASGVLVGTATTTNADTETSGERIRIDLGPGFAIGLHAVAFGAAESPGADADEQRWALIADPDISLTTAITQSDPRIIAYRRLAFELVTSGGGGIEQEVQQLVLPAPMLMVRDMSFIATNNRNGSTAGIFVCRYYYSIYEVTDAQFVRLAGVSLARG